MKEYIEKAVALEALSKSGVTCNMRAHKIVASIQASDVVEVRHGRWETAPCNGVYDMRCSACGFAPGIRFYSSDYCPNCGARMDKEDEHEAG